MPTDPNAFADLVVLTIKAALSPVLERIAALEAKHAALGDVRDRVVAIETKALLPPAVELPSPVDLTPLIGRITATEEWIQEKLMPMGERIASLEARASVPGPPGLNGKDGADGLGFDDFQVEHNGERAFTFKVVRGDRVKDLGTFTLPAMIYRGTYTDGKSYEPGDVVTWGGSSWHCRKATTLKPDHAAPNAQGPNGKDFWQLIVKEGREGKAGRDGRDLHPIPVVKVS